MLHYYRQLSNCQEICFNVEISEKLLETEKKILEWLLAETFEPELLGKQPFLNSRKIVEVGPRLNFATAWNTNAVAICKACGLDKIKRLEKSRRIILQSGQKADQLYDRMTEMIYDQPLESFEINHRPDKITFIPLKEEGPDALLKIPGISMDQADRELYYNYFVNNCGRNPTIVEIMDLNNANSEHSRHGFFKGRLRIDGQLMEETLLEIVQATLKANPNNSLIAFKDNSSVIRGYEIETIVPMIPGRASNFVKKRLTYHPLFTAETHNFPSGIAPFPGAETGTGGRIRDVQATGKGALVIAGTAGYCVGNLFIPNYDLPWENKKLIYPANLASPLEILIQASNGASDYGNKFGEPVINGFVRSGAVFLGKERREWLKPIMFTGGVGQIDDAHLDKQEPAPEMLIIQIGGPAYRIGLGGGAASSMIQGENKAELDFNAVQRGDAEMEQKMNRVIRACVEMGEHNPLVSVHDQGAGGPANVLKELVAKAGGQIDIRKITLGDPTLSVLEIWIAEYQERNALLLRPQQLENFLQICSREQVTCEVLGKVTGDGYFTVYDSQDNSTPVKLELEKVLGKIPQKTFTDKTVKAPSDKLKLPDLRSKENFREALQKVFKLTSVGSKRFLTNKVDRSVTGLIAQQQCCGPLQLTVSDYALIAQSHFPNNSGQYTGGAISIGEQPLKMLVNVQAGARLSVVEALTNIAFSGLSDLQDIKCSGNWMWAPKLLGEGSALYQAALAIKDLMIKLGIAIDGGKDSLSMAANVIHNGQTEVIKSPRELVISAYCSVPDITKAVTPDFKRSGSSIMRFDLGRRHRRLGGSALAQAYNQLGNNCPNLEKEEDLISAFKVIKRLVASELVLAAHDISDGGFITTVLEMAFAGNRGFTLWFDYDDDIQNLFAEEPGWAIEYDPKNEKLISKILSELNFPHYILGETRTDKNIVIRSDEDFMINLKMTDLRDTWEETSYQLERLQSNPLTAGEEKINIYDRPGPNYYLPFTPQPTPNHLLEQTNKPKVAIIREEGSNGDREMASAFIQAGFDCNDTFDVAMDDLIQYLLEGTISLKDFRGLAFVGGFSYADTLGAAKGWAGKILFNDRLRKMFADFYNRPDTFSLGVCNGCQLMALLGWVPGKIKDSKNQPRFIKNNSGRFESRFATVKILNSPAIMLKDMADSTLGIWVAHGEGRLYVPDNQILKMITTHKLAALGYVDDQGSMTEQYPFNPNGSPLGIAGLCDASGRHLAMMPHPERSFLMWQWPYVPENMKKLTASPWLKMFQNAREWCENN